MCVRERLGERERGREGEREKGRKGEREKGRGGGERERERERRGREGGREREDNVYIISVSFTPNIPPNTDCHGSVRIPHVRRRERFGVIKTQRDH